MAALQQDLRDSFLEDIQLSKKARRKLLELKNKDVMFQSIRPCAAPTSSVVILNGGLANGVTREFLNNLLAPVSPLRLLMAHRSEYAIVDLPTVLQAAKVKAQYDGREIKDIAAAEQPAGARLPQTTLRGPPLCLHVVFITGIAKVCFAPLLKQVTPQGLVLRANFISENEEEKLLRQFCSTYLPSRQHTHCQQEGVEKEVGKEEREEMTQESLYGSTQDSVRGGCLKLRRVEHYGYEFKYGLNNVDPAYPLPTPIPEECQPILERMLEQGLLSSMPDQLTVNEYQPGQGIPPHVDTHSAFEGEVVSLSLGSQCVMDMRQPDGGGGGSKVSLLLPRRSVLVLSGEARLFWTHGIAARKLDEVDGSMPGYQLPSHASSAQCLAETAELLERGVRVSLTFRRVRREPRCACGHSTLCDWTKHTYTQ